MAFEAKTVARFIPLSPRKVRLVIDQVRGLSVDQALALLKFMPMAAAEPVSKAVASAAANAEENLGLTRTDLFVKEIRADEGPRRQWRRFGARGRFKKIIRRSAHITVVLSER
jgi:large subunit ribosomal protein L22